MGSSPPLKTKLFIPQTRHSLVHRPRLIDPINAGTQRALTLISAPPGFGKTTVLAAWAAHNPIPLAWVSLDEGDNQPARFLSYLLFALDQIHVTGAGTANLLPLTESLPPRTILEELLRDLEAAADPFVIVLDDYHVITAQPVHDILAYLLDHLPPQAHLVLATRADPPIPLARLRSRGELVELRADDLRFTPEETAAFLHQVMGLTLRPEEINALEERTEGWIAGLQMAALSMQGHKDIPGFIRAFSGTHRFILDYLVEEVVNRQPEGIQQFLLQTSILERLCGPLCTAVIESRESRVESSNDSPFSTLYSQNVLEALDRSNLFLIPLDDERHWYRYHHLFAELLQARLQQWKPGWIATLHLRAAAWFEQNDFPLEAVQHALAAKDHERAAELIQRHGHERWSFSDLTFLMLLGQLPLEMLQARPKLGIYYAWMLITRGQLDAGEELLHGLVQHLPERGRQGGPQAGGDLEIQGIRGFIDLLFVYIATLAGRTDPTHLPGREALEVVPKQFLGMRNSADVVYAMLLSFRGEFGPAAEILLDTVQRDLAAEGTTATPVAIALLARLRILEGRLHEAAELCRKYQAVVAERGRWRFYLAGNLNFILGEVLREWNELEDAEREVREGLQINEPWQVPQGMIVGCLALARVQQARGDLDGASHTLAEAERWVAGRTITPDLANELRALRVYLDVVRGDLAGAEAWAEQLPMVHLPDFLRELDFILVARIRLAQGKYLEAQRLLEQLARQAQAGKRVSRQMKITLLWARALWAQGQVPEALERLETCLKLAEPEGFVRMFLDEGEPVRELLSGYLSSASPGHRSYAKRLLEAFSGAAPGSSRPALPGDLVEPLTERELEVLRLICTGCSNQEIAEKLVITLNTVKRHNNSLFGKLGVTNRSQAIVRARQLGLA